MVRSARKLDRLSRSLRDVLTAMEQLAEAKTGFRSLTEAIDTTTPAGRMMMQMAVHLLNSSALCSEIVPRPGWMLPARTGALADADQSCLLTAGRDSKDGIQRRQNGRRCSAARRRRATAPNEGLRQIIQKVTNPKCGSMQGAVQM